MCLNRDLDRPVPRWQALQAIDLQIIIEYKIALEPAIELAKNYRLSDRQISSIRTLIEAHANEFRSAWIGRF